MQDDAGRLLRLFALFSPSRLGIALLPAPDLGQVHAHHNAGQIGIARLGALLLLRSPTRLLALLAQLVAPLLLRFARLLLGLLAGAALLLRLDVLPLLLGPRLVDVPCARSANGFEKKKSRHAPSDMSSFFSTGISELFLFAILSPSTRFFFWRAT